MEVLGLCLLATVRNLVKMHLRFVYLTVLSIVKTGDSRNTKFMSEEYSILRPCNVPGIIYLDLACCEPIYESQRSSRLRKSEYGNYLCS